MDYAEAVKSLAEDYFRLERSNADGTQSKGHHHRQEAVPRVAA